MKTRQGQMASHGTVASLSLPFRRDMATRLVVAWSVFAFSGRGPVRNLIGALFGGPWCVSATVADEEHPMSSRRVLERLNLLEGLGQVNRPVVPVHSSSSSLPLLYLRQVPRPAS